MKKLKWVVSMPFHVVDFHKKIDQFGNNTKITQNTHKTGRQKNLLILSLLEKSIVLSYKDTINLFFMIDLHTIYGICDAVFAFVQNRCKQTIVMSHDDKQEN